MKGVQNTAVVKFQTRPRAMTGDSTNSAVYPTYATYRQAQHGNFDAFAQRIRRALESANAENRLQQQRQEEEEQEVLERQQTLSMPDPIISSHEEPGEKRILSALSAAHSRQLMDATETGSITSATGSLSSLSATKMAGGGGGGRPRSSSAASIISNLSEKIRIGGTTLFSRTGRSRAGSDASVIIPAATGPVSANASVTSGTATATPAIPLSEPSKAHPATTTMAAMASAAAVASAMTIPRSSAYNPDMDETTSTTPHGQAQPQMRRTSRHSAIMHPLAKASHMDDNDDDDDDDNNNNNNGSENDGSPERLESGNVSRTEIVPDDQERSC
ncbi:hypothetical protein EC968_004083 [Mortierella alpina]|nr:hypothetical protein EC968_004083 [Mortierella alpina]